ncbi:MAG: hypothetical protein WB710_15445 [Stellaceae bacterium]
MPAITRVLIAAVLLCANIGAAGAQPQDQKTSAATNPSPADPSPADKSQAPAEAGNAGQASPQTQPNSGVAPGSLSRELNRSGGVIRPPPTHDRGVVSPPNQGVSRTPVIPPPGSPGGNPEIQPK